MKLMSNGAKISARTASAAVTLAVLITGGIEWHLLNNLDHPKPQKISCIRCHSDKRTLQAMADKADDPLYLVHNGQLSLEQLNTLIGKCPVPDSAKVHTRACPAAKTK